MILLRIGYYKKEKEKYYFKNFDELQSAINIIKDDKDLKCFFMYSKIQKGLKK